MVMTQTAKTDAEIRADVQDYYGRELTGTASLQTSACLLGEGEVPKRHREILSRLHPEVLERFYGCGSPIPNADLTGATVLDVGCGTGRDVYLAAALVGPKGRVVGIDLTPEQLDIARKHRRYHAETFGWPEENVRLVEGDVLDVPKDLEGGVDLVISNCVLNLVPDKAAAFAAILRTLKPGGELYCTSIY